MFPLDEHAAVCEFEAEIQGKKIAGVVKEKEQAALEYNQAIRRGDGAYLLEQGNPSCPCPIRIGKLARISPFS